MSLKFIDAIYGAAEGWVSIVTWDDDSKPTIQRWFNYPEEREYLDKYIGMRSDEDVLATVSLFSSKSRTNADPQAVATAVGVDADTCHPDNFRVPPSIRVRTAEDRWQCWWVLDEVVPAADAANLAKRISTAAESLGCDKPYTHNVAKILRIPGTANSKHEGPNGNLWEVEAEYSEEVFTYDTLDSVYSDIAVGAAAARQEATITAADFDQAVFTEDEVERLREYAKVAWENDLAALENGMVPGSWHTTGYKIACNMFRNANVPWSGYDHKQVISEVTRLARVDSPTSQRELDRILNDAMKEVGSDSLAMPAWALDLLPDKPPEIIRGKEFRELEARLRGLGLDTEYTKALKDTETPTARTLSLSRALFRSGMTAQQVFSLMVGASANTHKNKRSAASVWADVQRAVEDPEAPDEGVNVERISFLEPNEREYLRDNPSFVDRYVQWVAGRSDLPETFARSLAYMVLSAVYAGKGMLRFKWGRSPLNLWLLLVGETTTRKSTAKSLFLRVVRKFEQMTGETIDVGSDATAEAIIQALGKRDGKTSLLHTDEVQGFFRNIYVKNYASGTLEVYTELYDGWVRVSLRATQGAGNSKRARTQFLFLGVGIRSEVAEILTKRNFESGFLARALWSVGEASKQALEADAFEFEDEGDTTEDPVMDALTDELLDGYSGLPEEVVLLRADAPALKRMNSWARGLQQMASRSGEGHILSAVSQRLGESVFKAAALLALHEGADQVTLRHVLFALEQAELWVKDMLIMLAEVSSSEFERRLLEVEQWVATGKDAGKTEQQINRHFARYRPQEIDEILRALRTQGRIRKKPDDNKKWEALIA